MITLSQILQMRNFLNNLHPQDSQVVKVSSPGPGSIVIEISGRYRARHMKIYRVLSLPHYTNLSIQPTLWEYQGPTYVVRNEENDCVKGVFAISENFVEVSCDIANWRDPTLRQWKQSTIEKGVHRKSQSMVVYPRVAVQCWGHNITFHPSQRSKSNKTTTLACPPYAFAVPASQSWFTSDDLIHTAMNVSQVLPPNLDLNVFHYHQDGQLLAMNEELNQLMAELESSRKKTQATSESLAAATINLGQYQLPAHHVAFGGWAVFILVIVILIIIMCTSNHRGTEPTPFEAAMEELIQQVGPLAIDHRRRSTRSTTSTRRGGR